jgi:hypothetical protein
MSSGRLAPRVAVAVAVTSMVVGIAGLVATLILSTFVFDEFDAYGEVPIPGRGSVDLPEGEVTISFHALVTGSDSGLPVPPLRLALTPPPGVADPELTENYSGTTTVNNDARVRVWVARVPAAGTYGVDTDGEVNGYISPRLAFGHDSSPGWPVWVFGGLIVVSVVELVAALLWWAQSHRQTRPVPVADGLVFGAAPVWHTPESSYVPTDENIRLEQLKTIAALRDSGALTQDEFEAEKRRILER